MADVHADTAALRAATGLDRGGRQLVLRVVVEVTSASPIHVVGALFEDRYGGREDYLDAVQEVRGHEARRLCETAAMNAEVNAEFGTSLTRRVEPAEAGAFALLMTMPEADFRLSVEDWLRPQRKPMAAATPRINRILQVRGAPWRFGKDRGFEWVGDELVEALVVRPAISALADRRFSGGVRSEFEAARNELRHDTPVSRKQAVHEAGCSVESAMKVVLDERGIAYKPTDAAQALFAHLSQAAIVPHHMERAVLGSATPRNKAAGHGAGAVAHAVATEEAEAVVASAAAAIAYLAKKLP